MNPDEFEPLCYIDKMPEWFGLPIKRRSGHQAEINKVARHLNLVDLRSKQIISDRSWALFEIVYEYVGGFYSYIDASDMAAKAAYIRAVYDGNLDNINDFEIEKCYAVATYNSKFGLKMTSIATNIVTTDKMKTRAAASKLQQTSLRFSWLECSGKAESFVMANGGGRYIIDPKIIKEKVYNDREVFIDPDGKHYTRALSDNGQLTRKIAVGTIRA